MSKPGKIIAAASATVLTVGLGFVFYRASEVMGDIRQEYNETHRPEAPKITVRDIRNQILKGMKFSRSHPVEKKPAPSFFGQG